MNIQRAAALCPVVAAVSTSLAHAQVNGLSVQAAMFGTPVIFDKHATAGPLAASGNFDLPGFYDFDAESLADYGTLGALARGNRADSFTGGNSADTLLVESLFQDRLALTGGTGQFRLVFEVEGLLTVDGSFFTTSTVRLNSSINASSVLFWERSLDHDDSLTNSLIIEETVYTDWIGFSGGSFENIFVKLSAQIVPDGFTGPFIASSEFLNTVRLAYIEVVDGSGNPLAATAVSASGAAYSVNAFPVPAEPFPALNITIGGGGVVISWPAGASAQGWHLESAPDLGPADVWVPVTIPPVLTGDRNTVTDGPPAGRRFYRLKR